MRVACQEELSWRDVHWTAPLWQLLAALERLSSLHPVSVLARKRLDVSFQDIGRACRLSLESLLLPGAASEAVREEASLDVSRAWLPASSKFRCNHNSTHCLESGLTEIQSSVPSVAQIHRTAVVRRQHAIYHQLMGLIMRVVYPLHAQLV